MSNQLLQRVARGDHDAFRLLFEEYAEKMHAAVYGYTKSQWVAEELVQEMFIRLWKYRQQLEKVEDTSGYLYRMTFNLINDWLKKTINEKNILEAVAHHKTSNPYDAEQQIRNDELKRILAAAIDQLPPQKKLIYQLNREQGFSYQEIAQMLQLSPSTVKNHLVEATKLLRTYLKNYSLSLALVVVKIFLSN
ncbi:RNA polymerase sigma factor [Chitinophaga arvensicola]|uniref:RNA polymerase sigma-70 factor, ECF subfamily n=1 Tax=Chitinophaga arvensicola TaxID=29529 RepID=A0A1I0PYS3_9BACT|nr:RNA polymerase sigma-70 factor [Chitinophaga arvensicola]SEW19620.1 RNA polymerase sigma-70 factor, ECF subfamily [Chitinophaga arvensicola]